MNLLILGGTAFVGRHLVEAALSRGHAVTIFHRGKTNPQVFPEVEKLIGERDGDLAALGKRTWDAAIDTSAYLPRLVDKSARALADRVGHYTFVSSVSVYKDFSHVGITENAPRAVIAEPLPEQITAGSYGAMKARCERAAANYFPGRLLVVRPGIVVGPYDYTGRFDYWPQRVADGGTVLAPGSASAPLQIIDGRDLAAWMLSRVKAKEAGLFNATGPAQSLTWGAFLEECRSATRTDATFAWVPDEALTAADVTGADLPLWVPQGADTRGFYAVSSARAEATGLVHRPLAGIVADVLAAPQGKAGLARTREVELLRRFTGV